MKKLRSYLYLSILFFGTLTACQAVEEEEPFEVQLFALFKVYVKFPSEYEKIFFLDTKINLPSLKKEIKEKEKLNEDIEFCYVENKGKDLVNLATNWESPDTLKLHRNTIYIKEQLIDVLKYIRYGKQGSRKYLYEFLESLGTGVYMKWLKKNKKEKIIYIQEEEKLKAYTIDEFLRANGEGNSNKLWTPERVIGGIMVAFIAIAATAVLLQKKPKKRGKKVKAEF